MSLIRVLALAAVLAGATWVLGWWSVPIAGAVYALVRRGAPHVVRESVFAAVLGWGALLAMQGTHPAFGRLSSALSGLFPVPVWALMLLSLGFAAALAGAAAALVQDR